MKPSSFCTICTHTCYQELIGLLLSLSLHHPNEKIYCMVDEKTKNEIIQLTPQPKLNIHWIVNLNKYIHLTRTEMVKKNIWSEFQMQKANVIDYALQNEKDVLFLDCDIFILDVIDDVNPKKELGVSPQFIQQENVKKTGYYNGGMLWTNNKNLPKRWKFYTKTSRYYDQAAIEDLAKEFSFFEFGENYNLQTWRFQLGLEPPEKIISHVNIKKNKIYYKNKPLKFVHTHFNSPRFKQINDFFIQKMYQAKLYKELLCLSRLIYKKWILSLPKQPLKGLGYHKNDSFRELLLLIKNKNKDVHLIFKENTIHCWLEPNILLYDRPTLEWCNDELNKSLLFLLGNGSINIEGKKLQQKNIFVKPWIFWPRRPMILEQILKQKGILSYKKRTCNTIFIGNFENHVQQKYRQTTQNWRLVLDEYHCTKGNIHKFTQEEYLTKLRSSRFGLCLRGYGSKCHREVELMAFGTVPIITPEVSITSYMNPLIENIHYIKISTPEELQEKIKKISEEKWQEMSNACYEWYQQNVHSDNCWNNMIQNLLFN